MRTLHITSELGPWSGTGGLSDVCAALPAAQQRVGPGVKVAVFSPLYRSVTRRAAASRLYESGIDLTLEGPPRKAARVVGVEGDESTWFVECPDYFDREGLYDDPMGWVHGDNVARFALLCRVALETAPLVLGGVPDVVHAHDWQAALALAYMRRQYRFAYQHARAVLTVHNLGYQGVFDKAWVPEVGLAWSDFTMDRFEFHDRLNVLKGGIAFSDVIVAPSPTYAEEICTEAHGHGLHEHLVAHRDRLVGVINGIDTEVWNPEIDPLIDANFSRGDLAGKAVCRRALMHEFGLDGTEESLVIGVVSRLVHQKGLDVLAEAAPAIVAMGARIAFVGSGAPELGARWQQLAADNPGRIGVRLTFDVPLSHRVEAGADAFLMPSRYEPCGLNQLYSMRYGTVPIVHAVGGLADTVVDADAKGQKRQANGFSFAPLDPDSLAAAVRRAVACFEDDPKRWQRLVANGMKRDSSWDESARRYLELYQG